MRIIFWGPYSGHVGTIQAQLQAAAALASIPSYDVALVRVHSEFTGHEEFCKKNGIELIDLRGSRLAPGLSESNFLHKRPYYIFSAILGYFFLKRIFKNKTADIVITNLISVIPLALKRLHGGPAVIASIQGYPQFLAGSTSFWKRLENRLRKALWSMTYGAATKIICMTQGTKAELEQAFGWTDDRFAIVPNPIITSKLLDLAELEPEHFFPAEGAVRIVSVGRLSRQKGYDVLLSAFARLTCPRICELHILGSGEDEAEMKEQARRLGVVDRVHFLGFVDNPYAIIKRADLFVMASRWEDPGHTLVEAAALQTPIVATDCPHGPREVLRHGKAGVLCVVDDDVSLAAAIDAALKRGRDDTMISAATKVAENYTPAHYKKTMSRLIEQITGSL